jgi:hypothetical protein
MTWNLIGASRQQRPTDQGEFDPPAPGASAVVETSAFAEATADKMAGRIGATGKIQPKLMTGDGRLVLSKKMHPDPGFRRDA